QQDEFTAGPSANQEGPQTKTNCYTYAFPEADSRFTTSNDSEHPWVVCDCGAPGAGETGYRKATNCDLLAGRGFVHRPEPSGNEYRPGRCGSAGSGSGGTPSRGSGVGASGDRNGIELEPGSDVAKRSYGVDAVDSDDSAAAWSERRV